MEQIMCSALLRVTSLLLFPLSLLAATGDPKWATVETNGNWIDVCFTSLGTGGTYIYGASSLIETNGWTNDFRFPRGYITGNDLSTVGYCRIDFTSPGFNSAGAAVSNPSVSYGTFRKRMPYNTPLTADEVVSGSDVICKFALSQKMHSGDTLGSVTLAVGLYTQGGNPSTAATLTGSSITNLSNVPMPRVIAMWGQYPYSLTASSDTLRVLAFHASATKGNMGVSCVKFWARDSAGTYTGTNIVTTGAVYSDMGDYGKVIEFKTTLDYSALAQGNTISNHFEVDPYRGPALNTADLVNGPTWSDYAPLVTYCNKSGTWKTVWANVDPAGNNATATCTTNPATAASVVAYTNLALAIQASGLTNFIFNGASNYGNCLIRITNGSYAIWGGDAINNRDPSGPWGPVIMPRPEATPSSCLITGINNGLIMNKTVKVMMTNIVVQFSANSALLGQGYNAICFDGCTINTNQGNACKLGGFFTNQFLYRNTFDHFRCPNPGLGADGAELHGYAKFRGNRFIGFSDDASSAFINTPFFVGNVIQCVTNEQYGLLNDNLATIPECCYDPCIFAFNKLMSSDCVAYAMRVGIQTNLNKGAAVVQNLFEVTKIGGGALPEDIMNSAHDNELCTNFLNWNNTVVGIYHYPFQLVVATNMTMEDYQDANNLFCDKELGLDCTELNATFTNRWAGVYSVDCMGNWCSEINNNLYIPGKGEFGYDGIGFGYSTNNPAIIQFANNTSTYGSTATNNTGGDYHLLSTSPLVGRIFTDQRLPYDMDGRPRSGLDVPGVYVAVPIQTTAFFGP